VHLLNAYWFAVESQAEFLGAELQNRGRSAVNGLSPDLRAAIGLRYTEDLSYDEIAAALGCAPGTVGSRLNRAHKVLHRRLAHLARPSSSPSSP
jgi:RNA polymerase sigma-70 factor, ECF subfamily